jgi:hypothetical protein
LFLAENLHPLFGRDFYFLSGKKECEEESGFCLAWLRNVQRGGYKYGMAELE